MWSQCASPCDKPQSCCSSLTSHCCCCCCSLWSRSAFGPNSQPSAPLIGPNWIDGETMTLGAALHCTKSGNCEAIGSKLLLFAVVLSSGSVTTNKQSKSASCEFWWKISCMLFSPVILSQYTVLSNLLLDVLGEAPQSAEYNCGLVLLAIKTQRRSRNFVLSIYLSTG